MNTCCIVIGPYRSGTSLTAKTLSHLGVYFGPESELYDASDFNPDGYYQRPDVSKANTRFFKSNSGSELEPPSPQTLLTNCHLLDYNKDSLHWSADSQLWGLKDPRLCISLSAWVSRGILPQKNLKVIFIRRNIEAASKSCSTHYDLGPICDHSAAKARPMISKYLDGAKWNINNIAADYIEISFEEFIKNPLDTVNAIGAFLGIRGSKILYAAERAKHGKSIYSH